MIEAFHIKIKFLDYVSKSSCLERENFLISCDTVIITQTNQAVMRPINTGKRPKSGKEIFVNGTLTRVSFPQEFRVDEINKVRCNLSSM